MPQLHVWGYKDNVSLIEPECIACISFLASTGTPFEIVFSNNTNLSPVNRLPILVTENGEKISGYRDIVHKVSKEPLSLEQEGLIAYITKYFNPTNQFNLYIVTENYEQYTRKLFKKYFPFPMMYNQPLKFYYSAQRVVRTVGLDSRGPGFFSFNGSSQSVAETEMINEDSEVQGKTKAISALHEKQLLAKSKSKEILRESTFKIKCLNLIDKTIEQVNQVKRVNQGKQDSQKNQETTKENSPADILLSSYLMAFTSALPDDFIASYISTKYPTLMEKTRTEKLQFDQLISRTSQRGPQGEETPSLWNEAKYLYNIIWTLTN